MKKFTNYIILLGLEITTLTIFLVLYFFTYLGDYKAIIPVFFLFLLPTLLSLIVRRNISFVLTITYYCFIICSNILATAFGFYNKIYFFDSILHGFFGFYACAIGMYILKFHNTIDKVPFLIKLLFCLCFSLSLAVLWEITEYTSDLLFNTNTQHVIETLIEDTMDDMIIHTFGAGLFNIIYCLDRLWFKNRISNYLEKII